MSSIDKVTLNNKSYDVSIAPNGNLDTTTVDKFVSKDTTLTPPEYKETPLISETDSHKSIFQKLTQMISNVRYLYNTGGGGQQELINKIYPIGSIYQSYNDTDPSLLFGGTWEAIGQGRVLVGASGTEYIGGATGGNKTHTLTTNEMPSHSHTVTSSTSGKDGGHNHWVAEQAGPTGFNTGYKVSTFNKVTNLYTAHGTETPPEAFSYTVTNLRTTSSGPHAHKITSLCASTGSGTEFNIEQPYLVVYMWRRTAL